jgi:hypothetical protein
LYTVVILDVLEKVIFSLTSDEVRRFKILSNRFKADDEKKLIILFDTIRSEKFADDEQAIVEDLYEVNNAQTRNRYYRLRNKLLENIEKSLAFYHFKYKDSIHAYYDIQLSIMFRERGGYQLALYFLKKAEKKAKELDQFNILEQIYHEYSLLALKDIEIDIEDILLRRKSNLEKVKIQRRNTEAVAIITQQLKKSNFSREKASVIDMLEKTQKSIEETAEIFHSAEGKIQIFRTVSALLLQKEAYGQLVNYARNTIQDFEARNLFNNDNHAERLLMRLWLINALFKTSRFSDAETELENFEKEMAMYRRQNYYTYLFHYTNTRINVLKALGKTNEAGELIMEALGTKELRSEPEHELYLMRSLADQHFILRDYAQALQVLAGIKKLPGYRLLQDVSSMYLELFEMVVHVDNGNYGFLPEHLKDFKKSHRKLLKSSLHERVSLFLEILEKINTAAEKGKLANLKQQLPQLQTMFADGEQGGNEIILYDVYAQAKASGANYYDLFLNRLGTKRSS